MKKLLVREFSPLILFILSWIIFPFIIIKGIPYTIGKGIIETFQLKFWKGPLYIVKYILNVLYQIWNGIKFILMKLAIFPDLIANATSGELIEDIITTEEHTYFGDGNVTISTAIGHLEHFDNLNEIGKKLSIVLSKVLDKDHCVASYKRHLHNQSFKIE